MAMHARFSQATILQSPGIIFTLSKKNNIETKVLLHTSHTPLRYIEMFAHYECH